MTPVQAIIVVIIRLWAASKLMITVGMVPIIFSIIFDNHSGFADSNTYTLSMAGFWVVAGLGAWIFAPYFSRKAAPISMKEGLSVRVDSDTLVMIGSFLIGGFYLIQFLPFVVSDIVRWMYFQLTHDSLVESQLGVLRSRHEIYNLIAKSVAVLISLWMMLRPIHVAAFFSQLRRAGLAKVEREDATPEHTKQS